VETLIRAKEFMLIRWTLIISLFVFFPLPALVRGEEPVKLEEMTVTGESPEDLLAERHEDPIAKMIIGRKEIEAFGDQRAGDVIKRLPGLFMGGPPGENKDVRLRGLDKEYTQILIDGERIPGEGEKREFQVDQIPVDMIERIEIIRNPTAEYDQDSVGGIINIILRKAPEKFTVYGRIGSGGQDGEGLFDTRDFSLNIGSGSEGFRYQVGGSFLETVLQKHKIKDKIENGVDKLEVENEEKTKRSSEIHLNLSYALTPRDDLSIRPFFLLALEEKEKEKIKEGLPENEVEEKDKETSRVSVKWKHRFLNSASLEIGGTANRQVSNKDKIKTKTDGSTELEEEKKEDKEWSLKGKYTLPLVLFDRSHLIKMGGKFRDKERNKRKEKGGVRPGKDNYNLDERIGAIFIQDEIEASDRLILTPGFRVEWTEGEFLAFETKLHGEQRFTTYHPSAHLLYRLRPKTNIRASFVRAIRRPKLNDLIPTREEKDDHIKIGNPFLRPEESSNYELAVERFWKKGFASLGGFYRDVDNKISELEIGKDSITTQAILEPVNVGDGKIYGFELELKTGLEIIPAPPFKDMSFLGNFSWFDSKVNNRITGRTHRFKNQPEFIFNLILAHNYKPWGLGANIAWNYVGEKMDDSKPNEQEFEESLSTVDLSIKKQLGKHFSLFFDAQNIFDEKKVKHKQKPGEVENEVESVGTVYLFGLRGTW